MKNLVLIISIFAAGCFSTTKIQGQAITDTLQWLKINIEQKNNHYAGKPLSVLLDTLAKRNIYRGIWQYMSAIISDGAQAESSPGDTIYTASMKIYFGNQLFGVGKISQIHRENPSINTHLRWMYLKFTQKIPFPTSITLDQHFGDQFGSVESICRPYIVQSVTVGEY